VRGREREREKKGKEIEWIMRGDNEIIFNQSGDAMWHRGLPFYFNA